MSDQEDDKVSFDHVRMSPAEELTSRLERGEFLTSRLIAEFIRKTPPAGWSPKLSLHVAGLLDCSAKAPRGRPRNTDAAHEDRLIQMIYPAVLRALQSAKKNSSDDPLEDLPEEFVDAVTGLLGAEYDGDAEHDKAKAITSILIFGHDGHVKKVQERYSYRKT